MNKEPYSKREIDDHFREVKEIMARDKADLREFLIRIETQTLKTNGRVTKLEAWGNLSKGAIIVMNVIAVPLVGWLLYTTVDLLKNMK